MNISQSRLRSYPKEVATVNIHFVNMNGKDDLDDCSDDCGDDLDYSITFPKPDARADSKIEDGEESLNYATAAIGIAAGATAFTGGSPTPTVSTTSTDHDGSASSSGIEFDHGLEPVVILLGWMGCKDKHLVKYSSFYDNKR